MTPKEKAKELRTLFAQELIDLTDNEDLLNSRIKNCALILVHEIIPRIGAYSNYWVEVKEEIYKL
jgi:hypothetical protein